jgi:hypothetical protein
MDATKAKTIEDVISSFKNNTSVVGGVVGPLEIDGTMIGSGGYSTDTITLSPNWPTANVDFGTLSPNITIGGGTGFTYSNTNIGGAGVYTIGSAVGANWNNNASGQINLDGDNADIKINGKSLMATLTALEQRLNILTPNPKLEADWDELRELGERYRALEKQCEEKAAMWEKLKSMPAPDIT